MPLQATSGAASQDAFGGNGVAVVPTYIEDVFSTYLYTGTSAARTITNNIDLSGKGGLVWIKARSAATNQRLFDTARGATKYLASNGTGASTTDATSLTAFNPSSFSLGDDSASGDTVNGSGVTYASWTFRKQPKFFDVVTYTGNGVSGRSISHNLGSDVGVVIIKKTSAAGDWIFWHRSLSTYPQSLLLNTTDAAGVSATYVNGYVDSTTSTTFTVNAGSDDADINASGATYVAYLFAHNAGGFGLTGTDNVISCGTYTGTSAVGNDQNLGFEPQWILIKRNTAGRDWEIIDNMRGWATNNVDARLQPNLSNAESTSSNVIDITSTGFNFSASGATSLNTSGVDYYYIAIRRGPMKVPTTGTSVFAPVTGNFSSPYTVTTNFPVDLTISSSVTGSTRAVNDRLRGGTTTSYNYLNTTTTAAESTGTGAGLGFQNNTAVIDNNWQTGSNAFWWNFRRAPSFMDVVCYTGNGSTQTIAHNLGVVPELILGKNRTTAGNNFPATFNFTSTNSSYAFINLTSAGGNDIYANVGVMTAQPTSTNIYLSASGSMNTSGAGQVAYLFATCAGVSKVGSYTGTGATQTIDCGFGAGGARFVLIKRTDSTGDWWVWDSARGMVSGTDPRIDLNVGNPQTNANWVYTISTGFQIVTTDASVNANGGTYIFLAIA